MNFQWYVVDNKIGDLEIHIFDIDDNYIGFRAFEYDISFDYDTILSFVINIPSIVNSGDLSKLLGDHHCYYSDMEYEIPRISGYRHKTDFLARYSRNGKSKIVMHKDICFPDNNFSMNVMGKSYKVNFEEL